MKGFGAGELVGIRQGRTGNGQDRGHKARQRARWDPTASIAGAGMDVIRWEWTKEEREEGLRVGGPCLGHTKLALGNVFVRKLTKPWAVLTTILVCALTCVVLVRITD